jgi:hypothetical protein
MFGINLSTVSMISSIALGPAGGMGMQLATQVFANMGQQLLQGMGERMNLPQAAIDLETAGFSAKTSGIAGGVGGLNDSIEALGRNFDVGLSDIQTQQQKSQDAIQEILNNLSENDEVKEARASGGRSGGSWLRAMAQVLGEKLDASAEEMNDLANRVTKDSPSTTTDFTVASQEFNMLMNAATTGLKTIGEAMGKAASRQ